MISEDQQQEIDSLAYIYFDGELNILEEDPVHLQVKVASSSDNEKSPINALLDLHWGENYPNEIPEIKIICFGLKAEDNESMVNKLKEACNNYMGAPMTYVLSSELSTLLTEYKESELERRATQAEVVKEEIDESMKDESSANKSSSKSKSQKANKSIAKCQEEEKPRGYNWVDVMAHLRKT